MTVQSQSLSVAASAAAEVETSQSSSASSLSENVVLSSRNTSSSAASYSSNTNSSTSTTTTTFLSSRGRRLNTMSNRCRRHHRTLLQPNINTAATCTNDCCCFNTTTTQNEFLQEEQSPIQSHPTSFLPLRSGTTVSSSSSSFLSSSTSTTPINKKLLPKSRRRGTRYLLSSIFMFCTLTIVSWSMYLSRSHSIQQLLLESRHPLAGNNHYRNQEVEQEDNPSNHFLNLHRRVSSSTGTTTTTTTSVHSPTFFLKYYRYLSTLNPSGTTIDYYESVHRRLRMPSSLSSSSASMPSDSEYDAKLSSILGNEKSHSSTLNDDSNSKENANYLPKLRILAFGASSTWGQGLPLVQSSLGSSSTVSNNRDAGRKTESLSSSRKQQQGLYQRYFHDIMGSSSSRGHRGRSTRVQNDSAATASGTPPPPVSIVPYPNILDPKAVNAAVPYHGPDEAAVLAAACTQSIVGSSTGYNVITIEISSTDYTASQDLLVQRLRRRFPDTTIVVVVLPNPLQQIKLRLRQDTLSLRRPRNVTAATTISSSNSGAPRDITLVEWLQNPNVVYPTKTRTKPQQKQQKSRKDNTELRGRIRPSSIAETEPEILDDDDDEESKKDYWYNLVGSSMADDTRGVWYYDSAVEVEEELSKMNFSHHDEPPKIRSKSYQRLMKTVESDGNIVLYKFPTPNLTSATEITNYLHWFENIIPYIPTSTSSPQQSHLPTTSVVLSAIGHEQVADDLRQVLVSLFQTPSSDRISDTNNNYRVQPPQSFQVQEQQPFNTRTQYEEQRQLDNNYATPSKIDGSWGSGDACHLWYDTGRYDLQTVGGTTNNIDFTNPSSIHEQAAQQPSLLHKHVLEFTTKGTLKIYNPFPTERIAYLTYLTDDDNSYPRTRISINNIPSVIIEPFGSNTMIIETRPRKRQVLEERSDPTPTLPPPIPRTSAVGYIPAKSEATIGIEVVQTHTMLPFRLIGASFLATEIIPTNTKGSIEKDISSTIDVEFSFEREIQ